MQIDLQKLSALVGAPVIAAERCAMGFENRTDRVTLADGTQRIVQQITSHDLAPHKVRLAQVLPDRFAAVGIRLPRVLAANAYATPPYIVREYVPGTLASTLLADEDSAVALARAMGALLPRLAQVGSAGLGLHRGWADPQRLARQSQQHLSRCRALLDHATVQLIERAIADAPRLLDGRGCCFAHGDFCPVNALIAEEPRSENREPDAVAIVHRPSSIVSLLDVEFARVADPLFDAAWWVWVVRFHHEERWRVAWSELLAAAGIPDDDATTARISVLQRLRCLETLNYYRATRGADGAAAWAQRLAATARWEES